MLAKILKEKRTELGQTQQEIADKLNVTRQTVSSWEVGKSIPDISSLIEISELYDISLDYMLKGDEKVTEKLKDDTVELKFLRFFSKSSLIIISILLIIIIPMSMVFIAVIFIYITVFQKKHIKIITSVREEKPMKNKTSQIGQAFTYSFSVIGGVTLFYILVALVTKNNYLLADERSHVILLILFIAMTFGRYLRYRKDNK